MDEAGNEAKLSCSLLNANTQETSVGGKGKVAVFRRPATWGDGGLCPRPSPSCQLGDGDFKGSHLMHNPQIGRHQGEVSSITSLCACGQQFSFVEVCFPIPVKTA